MSLKTLFGLLNVFLAIWNWFKSWTMKQEARKEVAEEINRKDQEIANETATIVVDRPTDDDLDKRLRDGNF